MSSNAGRLILRETEVRVSRADRHVGCLIDSRNPERSEHTMATTVRFPMLIIAAGYADGTDTSNLALRSCLQDGDRAALV